jgi:hypothetical protein
MLKTTATVMTALLLTTGVALAQPGVNPAHGSQAVVAPEAVLMMGSHPHLLGAVPNGTDQAINKGPGPATGQPCATGEEGCAPNHG